MSPFSENLQHVRQRIAAACQACDRDPASVHLLAVSKTRPAAALREAAAAGQRAFGENYLQEALAKMDALADLRLEWHFIGRLQSNKARAVAVRFHWLHSLDSIGTARRLSAQRPTGLPPLNVCLQVNVSGEASKGGLAATAVPALAEAVACLPGLRLRGLMAIPAAADNPADRRRPLAALRSLFEQLRKSHPELDTLSMGMSDDLTEAIAEGATLVRVGTALFGPRPPRHEPPHD